MHGNHHGGESEWQTIECTCEGLSEETCGGVNPYNDMHFEPFELTYESQDDWGHRKSLQQIEKEHEHREESKLGRLS